ncbi:cytochrome P450 [Streptomyces violaceus]|uniref:Cytochrome P450 n=1 Tax=Streptomyces violaceus TaxID=1936 RepID=A0ABY9U489_STRVL|nr:cytochrome P450 [Streptomyces janthinus]WND16695.1 cytochrome P450 [Streptomyces janthinus]GGS43631.1 cytochrome P450 [Streptomyces janthinus]
MRLTPGAGRVLDLEHVDLFDLDLYTSGDPHSVWDAMRETAPLHHQVLRDGREFWSVTRYDDVCRVLGDHHEFTSERGTVVTHLGVDDVAAGLLMTSTDPPRHTQVRRAIGARLTARVVASWQDRIRQSIVYFLESALDGGSWDLAEQSLRLPAIVTGPLLGIPERDWDELVQLTAMVTAPSDPHFQHGSEAATLAIAHHELVTYVTEWVKRRRSAGSEDGSLLDHLMGVRAGDAPLTDEEIAYDGYSILLGANVTTPHTISGTVLALIERPEQFAKAQADPSLVPNLVEEGLRWTSPACNFMRYATGEARIAGGTVPAGGAVVAWIGSANRDESRFTDPHEFDVTRSRNRHVAFGFGPHYCVGAPLARMTLRIFFEELLRRFESLGLDGEPEHLRSFFIAGLTHLRVVAGKRKTP